MHRPNLLPLLVALMACETPGLVETGSMDATDTDTDEVEGTDGGDDTDTDTDDDTDDDTDPPSVPCENSDVNGAVCDCDDGWTGHSCAVAIERCDALSCTRGVCDGSADILWCACEPGWYGAVCDSGVQPLFVDADAAPQGDGLSWETAYDALADAEPTAGQLVYVRQGELRVQSEHGYALADGT